MGIFKRFVRLFKSIINFFLGKAENHNPQLLLNQAVADMQEQLNKCRREVAEAIAEEKKLSKQVFVQREQVQQWTKRAEKAVMAGDDELAREALKRKKEHQTQLASLEAVHLKQVEACSSLKEQLRGFNDKIEEAKRKKGVLVARHEAAEARQQIADAQSSFNENGAFATFEQMEGRIDEIEAQAEATYELSEETSGDALARKFDELESSSSADDDLTALKQQMGLAPKTRVDSDTVVVDDIVDEDETARRKATV